MKTKLAGEYAICIGLATMLLKFDLVCPQGWRGVAEGSINARLIVGSEIQGSIRNAIKQRERSR